MTGQSQCRRQPVGLISWNVSPLGEVAKDATLQTIATKYGKSPSQVALRWLIEQDGVAAIPKASSERHCLENFQIFDFALSADDMAAIAKLTGNRRLINPSWAPEWDAP